MRIMNVWKGLAKGCMAFLVMLSLLFMVTDAWAVHEVSQSDITANVLKDNPTQWTEDLTVQWTEPDFSNNDILQGYIYKWSNSATQLSDTVFNRTTGLDGFVDTEFDPPNVVKSSADLANLDSDLLYLHIKTWYLDLTTGEPTFSSDVVYGPFIIDNVAPTGTVSIVDVNGADVTSTSDTRIYLKLAATKDPAKVYLSETAVKPSTSVNFSTDPIAWDLVDTATGAKTLYAWFEDSVGNASTTPVTDSFTLLAPVSISPNTATIDLASGGTQTFRVEGTTDSYTWNISNTTVAGFSGGVNTGNSVTVQALQTGTFTLTATPTAGSALTSGTITVIQTTTTVDIPLSVGWNLISIPVQPANTAIATALSGIAGKYSIVWGEFNPATSTWKSYNPSKPSNTLTSMVPNKGYWINVTTASTLSVSGTAAAKEANLETGWNLVGYSGTSDASISAALSSISGKYSIVWGEFNPATSTWKSYNPSKPSNTLSTFGAGKGYWINATQSGTLSY